LFFVSCAVQWLKVLPLGTGPPPLMYASVGYDPDQRRLVIFGGESSGGQPYGGTHLLNFDTMTWSKPTPPTNFQTTPPARSRAMYSMDLPVS
jgi:Galactose oxidase, central domain